MTSFNKFATYIMIFELVLTLTYISSVNRVNQVIFENYRDNVKSFEDINLYYTLIVFISILLQLLLLLLFFSFLWIMQRQKVWVDTYNVDLIFRNKSLMFKLIVAIFIGHSLIYLVNDLALAIDTLTVDYEFTLTRRLNSVKLRTSNSIQFQPFEMTNKTLWIFMMIFVSDIILSIIYSIMHVSVIILFEYFSKTRSPTRSDLYPQHR